MIAVTGATGALGGRVAARLAAAGDVPLRLVVRDADRAIRATGVRCTFLRSSMYADFVPFFATAEDGAAVIAAPAGRGATGFVSRDDLADAAVAVLLDETGRIDGEALEVTGPAALTMAEAADVLTEVTGRPSVYREQTVEEAWATRRPSGHPDW